MKYFQANNAEKMLEQAIEEENAKGIVKAIKAGANPHTQAPEISRAARTTAPCQD